MKCPKNDCKRLQLSMDGVQESKSSTVSMDIYSVKFEHCQKVYPIRLIKPINKNKYDEQEHLKMVIDDINRNMYIISKAILDNPKRSMVRCALCHSATYGCEYCEACAVVVQDFNVEKELASIKKKYEIRRKNIYNTIELLKESPGTVLSKARDNEKIAELQAVLSNLKSEEDAEKKCLNKKKHLAWPFSTMTGRLRTVDLIKYMVSKIVNSPHELDKHETKGFKGKSHLLYQENFHFINDLPCEYMHSGCLGVVKRLLEHTFSFPNSSRDKVSNRKLSDTSTFNEKIKKIKFFRECNRRARNLDLSVIKAQEYRNIILFFFPLVIDCIQEDYPKEKKIGCILHTC